MLRWVCSESGWGSYCNLSSPVSWNVEDESTAAHVGVARSSKHKMAEEAYHLEALRRQRMNERRQQLKKRHEGKESKVNSSSGKLNKAS